MSEAVYVYKRRFWRELKLSLRGCRFKLSLNLDLFEEGFCLDLFGFLIPLLFLDRYRYQPYEIMESWGIKYFERAIWLHWGRKYKSIYMPWMLDHMKVEVLRPDGRWVPYVASYDHGKEPDGRWQESYPYQYRLRSGEVQERTATIYVERREWRQKWLRWCPLFAKKSQSIDVQFSDEVGERSGSWKGGCIGCGYEMRKGESPRDTLRRMERERVFN